MNFGYIDGGRSLSRSRIFKFEKILDPDADSKILEQGRSRILKMWLRPSMVPIVRGNRPNMGDGWKTSNAKGFELLVLLDSCPTL